MSTALILHPELGGWNRPQPEITDELRAARIAAAYDDGAYMALERVEHMLALRGSVRRRALAHLAPSYVELRDYLHHEENVAYLLACRVALRFTRFPGIPTFHPSHR